MSLADLSSYAEQKGLFELLKQLRLEERWNDVEVRAISYASQFEDDFSKWLAEREAEATDPDRKSMLEKARILADPLARIILAGHSSKEKSRRR